MINFEDYWILYYNMANVNLRRNTQKPNTAKTFSSAKNKEFLA